MSGSRRFEHANKPTVVKRDRLLIPLAFGLAALGIVISLVFAHYGWAPAESIAP
jgi:hypothetical protein